MKPTHPGIVGLSGAKAQGLVSHAIKYGSTLRFQPAYARAARIVRYALMAAAVVLAIVLGWSLLGAVAALAVGWLAGVVATWFIAEVGYRAKPHAYWNRPSHAFFFTGYDHDGHPLITEAVKRGVVTQRFHYKDDDWEPIDPGLDPHDLEQALRFAASVVAARQRYGFVGFFGLFLFCLSGTSIVVHQAGTSICSGLVSECLVRGNAIFPRPPHAMMPANLAAYYGLT